MPNFYHVRTHTSHRLEVDPFGTVCATKRQSQLVVLLQFSERPTLGVMFAESAGECSPITIDGVAIKAAIQPWRVRPVETGVVLIDPAYGTMLAERDDGTVGLQSWETNPPAAVMRLEPIPTAFVSPAMSRVADLFAAVLPANLNGPDMLDVIINLLTPDSADLVQALIRLLPRDQIVWLGGTVLGLPRHLALLSAAFPNDIWAKRALPDFREWLLARKRTAQFSIPEEWDFLAEAGLNGRPTSASHMLSAAARAAIPPRRPVCVVATARNEGMYLLEWVAYHRLLGADALFVYSNDNSDGSDDILRALAIGGEITWIENTVQVGRCAQPKAYGHAFGVLPDVLDYRWSLVIDLDEFFSFDASRFNSLPQYIDWQETQRVDAIALNCLVFGSNTTASWNDAPMIERFTKRLPWIDAHIKSLTRTGYCLQSHPHHAAFDPLTSIITRDSDGAIFQSKNGLSFAAAPRADNAWISHYFLKSAEEFIWKFSRNRGDHALVLKSDPSLIDKGFAEMFLQQHQSPTMIDDHRTIACAPGLRQEILRLKALPGVAAACDTVVRKYRVGLESLMDRLRSDPQFRGVDSPFAKLLKLCNKPQ